MNYLKYFQDQIDSAEKKYTDRGDLIPPLVCFFIEENPNTISMCKEAADQELLEKALAGWEYVANKGRKWPSFRKIQ